MAADRARVSHDPSREYRAVVPQQGRVTLEADGNEASRIAEDALRADVVDIVGPFGTPDNGYEVVAAGATVTIGAGSYYLGGWRVDLAQPTALGAFADEGDLGPAQSPGGNYAVALLLTEQEVSAVEDRALLEVALGGPDTCQRTRLMQRAVAIPVRGDDCAGAEAELDATLLNQGAAHDHATGFLKPTARLQVQVINPPVPADPCDPPASGGYLGADNQLIRVSVASYDPGTGKGELVWGFDNGSTLYRAATVDGQLLTLETAPIDNDHAPRLHQAVEVLQTRRLFDNGDVVAADAGLVTTVLQPYNPDLRTVGLAATLAAGSHGDAAHPLFLRLWQEVIPFANGVAVPLGDTGFAVTLSLGAAPGPVVARPFWTFAVRPSTPVIVYPRRYLAAPQPPEGPRQWLAPLAVATLGGKGAQVLDDCRDTFAPLTRLRPGCCGVMLDAGMRGHRDFIQRALDRLRGTRGTVTLRPGHYRLRQPIRMDSSHKGLTLEGCGEGVFLEAEAENDPAFAQGLIVLDDVNEVSLRWLQLQMPTAQLKREQLPGFAAKGQTALGSVGISATSCAQLTVTHCQMRFRMRAEQPIIAVGLLARGECWGLTLTRNGFLHDPDYEQTRSARRLLFGYALLPAIRIDRGPPALKQLSEAGLDALLEDAEIADNRFVGLTFPILVYARLGLVRVERNRVKGCSAGIYLLESALGTALRTFRHISGDPDRVQLVPLNELAAAMSFAAAATPAGRARVYTSSGVQLEVRRAKARAQAFLHSLGDANAATGQSVDATPAPAGDAVTIEALLRIAAAIDSRLDPLTPALHVHANDIDVLGRVFAAPAPAPKVKRAVAIDPASGRRIAATGTAAAVDVVSAQALDQQPAPDEPVYGALQIILDQRDGPAARGGDLLVTSNRLAGLRSPAVRIGWPRRLVFGSNIVVGGVRDRANAGPALAIITDARQAMLEVMGNVVDLGCAIVPAQRPHPPSQDWTFVNRAG